MFMRAEFGSWVLLLIAIGIGYFVCLKASKEGTKLFKYGGYVIGIIILATSLIFAFGGLVSRIRQRRRVMPRRRTTRPVTRPTARPEIPRLPRRAVGVTEPKAAE